MNYLAMSIAVNVAIIAAQSGTKLSTFAYQATIFARVLFILNHFD